MGTATLQKLECTLEGTGGMTDDQREQFDKFVRAQAGNRMLAATEGRRVVLHE